MDGYKVTGGEFQRRTKGPVGTGSDTGGSVFCALLSYRAAFQDSSALALAVKHGEHILRSAEELPSGLAWKETNSTHLTGFAHGAAGIAYALGRVFRESGEERFRNVAMEALRF